MCGIFYSNYIVQDPNKVIEVLKPRGPDYQKCETVKGKTFIHTRLAIIDLDHRSNQPFLDDGLVLIFNGEIYNYKYIKEVACKDYKFKTESDTETIIALYKTYGIDGFKYLEGMFAFVLHDCKKQQTYFLRDPTGIKPLYYYLCSNKMIVASTIQAIQSQVKLEIDYRGINYILSYGWTCKPCYKNVYEFEPGILYSEHLQKIKIPFMVYPKTIKDCIIEQYVNSDRPVGVLLSGGIDSGYIAFVCAREAAKKGKKIHTYTIGFTNKDQDIVNAREVAKFIGSEHHEIIISDKDYEMNLLNGLFKIGMPIDLGSVSLTNAIGAEIAKTNIKVLLSGDGSDEIQAGYKRYAEKTGARTNELWEWYKQRIVKNNLDERKKILGENAMNVELGDIGYPDNANKILWCDFQNELRYYHLKRMDHIISSFGIELRVPYCDYNFIITTFNESFSKKVNQRGNKLLLRDFAVKDGYPTELAFKPKIPMKSKTFDAAKHLIEIWKKFK